MPSSAEWLVFLGTATLFAIMPGPGIFYVLARSLNGGRSEGIQSVVGNGIGACVHVVAAAFGLSAVLATSATAFTVVKLVGAAYLVYLGVMALFARDRSDGADVHKIEKKPGRQRSVIVQGAIAEMLNPKTALYFLALLPHFVHPERDPAPLVFAVLGLIAVAMAVIVDIVVAVFAGYVGGKLRDNPKWRIRQRIGTGLTMIGLGGLLAFAEQN
ncbi:threonine/homoserine/homoserine lactone efflux protein [Kibdelosporangium banguiense]|uniref:Threonine/homoserine/homoserine lactone efflux protein n=1 Tax=Kibdelosporangium banguiense TaxID=1365924 RepID=A0ABS4U2M0_9PSEU|nr:LysE family translocator [Kibdelosporangium banguiense]MBP2330900.1 threonine/homoserine/homoserine lactone efflux protein [Kibdelosporangium banguiense]